MRFLATLLSVITTVMLICLMAAIIQSIIIYDLQLNSSFDHYLAGNFSLIISAIVAYKALK